MSNLETLFFIPAFVFFCSLAFGLSMVIVMLLINKFVR